MEQWCEVRSFPGYLVSSEGSVVNQDTGRHMTLLRNQQGIVNVGLTKDKIQYKRSVSLLVADAFVPRTLEHFICPINLDGDRSNNRASNLLWRSRGFAVEYFAQFNHPIRGRIRNIQESKTGEIFDSSWEAALKYGLLDKDIYLSILNRTYTWPTYQIFLPIW